MAQPKIDPSAITALFTPEQLKELGLDSPEFVQQMMANASRKELQFIKKAVPVVAQMHASAEVVEQGGPLAWVKRFYPQTFDRDFTSYQKAFWQFGWDIQPDTYYAPRVECAPRGAGKSTTAETWLVSVLARKRRSAVGYVSNTDKLADKHFAGVKRKLENGDLLRAYPHLKPQVQKYRNAFNSWSQDRLVTEGGQTIIPITLHGSNRGFKSDDDMRFDLIIYDDIDTLGESPDVIAKNLDLLKSEIILAGNATTLHVVFQNLIHRESIVSKMLNHSADMLNDREFFGPYPLMKWYDAERIDLPNGGKRWVFTAGEVYDPALPKEYCESILNQVGKDLFDRECQQEVTKVGDDKDFREWDEVFHVITQSEMVRGFPNVQLRDSNGFFIPSRWHVGRGFDWGTTPEHPSCVTYVTRPDKTCPHDDAHFVFAEICMPRFPRDHSVESELVSPGRVAHQIKVTERTFRIQASQIEQSKMSHEASAAKNTLMLDLPEGLTVFFNKWKAAKGSGVPQIQNMLEIDKTKAHPFRTYPAGHKHAGMPIMGRPRIYFVVADNQGELYCDSDGKLRVRGYTDSSGFARARYEIPLYSHRNSGAKKIDDDLVDSWRGLMSTFGVAADQLTKQETVVAATPHKYRAENVFGANYRPELEMSYHYVQAQARQKAAATMQTMTTFNEFGQPEGEDSADMLW